MGVSFVMINYLIIETGIKKTLMESRVIRDFAIPCFTINTNYHIFNFRDI